MSVSGIDGRMRKRCGSVAFTSRDRHAHRTHSCREAVEECSVVLNKASGKGSASGRLQRIPNGTGYLESDD